MNTPWGAEIPGDLIPDWIELAVFFFMFLSVWLMVTTPCRQQDEFKSVEALALKFRHHREEGTKTEARTPTGETEEEARQRHRRLKRSLRR